MRDIMDYTKNENFKYLVIKASHGNYYGFNLRGKNVKYEFKITSLLPNQKYVFIIVLVYYLTRIVLV